MRLRLRSSLIPIALVAALLPGAVRAAVTPDAEEALARARSVYLEAGPAPALPLFEDALARFRAAGDRRGEAITLGLLGNCHKRLGDPERALGLLGTALEMKRELGDRLEEGKTLSHLGLVLWEQADYDAAIGRFEEAIAIGADLGDAKLEGSALNNLALVYDERGDYERSLAQYRRALELYRRTDFPRGEGDTLGNIGGVHLLLGRYREALEYYRRALAISERLGAKPAMSQDIGNIALCHAGLGEVDEAAADFDRALALARDAGLDKEEADWLKGKGAMLVESGRHSEGLELFRQALDRYESSGLQRERVEALQELARLYLDVGDALAAEKELRSALDQARAIGYERGVHSGLVALGELEWRRQRIEQAVALYREALDGALAAGDRDLTAACHIQLAYAFGDQARYAAAREEAQAGLDLARAEGARLPAAEALFVLGDVERRDGRLASALESFVAGELLVATLGDPEVAWRLAHGRGRTLEALGRDGEALVAYRRAVERIETVRGRLREERFRAGYIEDRYRAYVDLSRLLLRLGFAEEAFASAERLRARSYLDLLSRGRAPVLGVASARRERELRQRIRALQQSLDGEERSGSEERRPARAAFSAELAAAEREYAALLSDLSATDPVVAATWSLAVPSTAEIQAALPPDAALLEYLAGEQEVLLFVLTRERFTYHLLPVARRDLEAKVGLLHELIERRNSGSWRLPAASLGALLVEPAEEAGELAGRRRLFLVPHGILHHLPFAALPRGSEGRLLVEDYDLTLLPSAGAFVLAAEGRRAPGQALALAPGSSRLRHAADEARAVVAASPRPSRLLLGGEATERAFKQMAGTYRVLHLATHSSWNRLNPLLSGLELEKGAGEDGRLQVHEILGLQLGADLVTLSACETALGSDFRGALPLGDDLVGLTRAFLHAGSEAVLASLWEVDDRSTLDLMSDLYARLPAAGVAGALASAQRVFLADPDRSHPYRWAAFVVVAAPRSETP